LRPELIGYLENLTKCGSDKEAGELLLTFFHEMGADGGNIWFAEENNHIGAINAETTSYTNEMLEFMYKEEAVKEQILPKRVAREYDPKRWGWDIDNIGLNLTQSTADTQRKPSTNSGYEMR